MKNISVSGLLLTTLMSTATLAQTNPYTQNDAELKTAKDSISCMIYYNIVAKCSSEDQTSQNVAQKNSELSANIGTERAFSAGQSAEWILSFAKSSAITQRNLISASCSNLSVITNTHGYCKKLLSNPEEYKLSLIDQKSIISQNISFTTNSINHSNIDEIKNTLDNSLSKDIDLNLSITKSDWQNHVYIYTYAGKDYLNLSDNPSKTIYSFGGNYSLSDNIYKVEGNFSIKKVSISDTIVYLIMPTK